MTAKKKKKKKTRELAPPHIYSSESLYTSFTSEKIPTIIQIWVDSKEEEEEEEEEKERIGASTHTFLSIYTSHLTSEKIPTVIQIWVDSKEEEENERIGAKYE